MQKTGTYNAENGDIYTSWSYINTDFINPLKEIKKNKSNLKEKKRKKKKKYRKWGLKWNFNEINFYFFLYFYESENVLLFRSNNKLQKKGTYTNKKKYPLI